MSSSTLEATTIEDKTKELCQLVLEDAKFTAAREKITTFLADTDAQEAYSALHQKGHAMHQMQHEGTQPAESDMAELNGLKQAAADNEVTAGFMDAEGELNEIFSTVTKYLQKTLQLGKMPEASDFEDSDCCSEGGCDCH
jgi:cell fate (sporulation/competence/biofilm development) regulator YlbF (YheA/YmcA/DUF963 family)